MVTYVLSPKYSIRTSFYGFKDELGNLDCLYVSLKMMSTKLWRWEKPQEGGCWIVFSKTSSLRSEELFPGSESEIVQSLSEFRVLMQRINVREQRKKEHKQLYRFLPQTGSSLVPLALPRRVPLKCNVKLQVAQSHKKETSQFSRTTPRDFYAQSHLKETSMLKDNSKRLPLLDHYSKRLILTITKNWIRFWILDVHKNNWKNSLSCWCLFSTF